jgi:AcrR family transcriptional regulator
MEAMLSAVAERGYPATTIAHVVRRAGSSRATFYEYFPDKEACFLAAYDGLIAGLVSVASAPFDKPGTWPDRARAAVEALLENLAAYPDGARVALKEALGAGPAAHARFHDGIQRFSPFIDEGRKLSPRGADIPSTISLTIVGGIAAVIIDEIAAGNTTRLPELLPDLLYLVLAPIIGHDAAWEEIQRG